MNNFITRTLSAIVYAGLVIGSILVQPVCFGGHPLLFGVLFIFNPERRLLHGAAHSLCLWLIFGIIIEEFADSRVFYSARLHVYDAVGRKIHSVPSVQFV